MDLTFNICFSRILLLSLPGGGGTLVFEVEYHPRKKNKKKKKIT